MNKTQVGVLTALMSLVVVLLTTQNYNVHDPLAQQWAQWKQDNSFLSSNDIELYRKMIFVRNIDLIERHNSNERKNFEMGLNQFSHLSTEEFDQIFSSKKDRKILEEQVGQKFTFIDTPSPNDVDWEKQGKISPVKNQGQCDAGYAFCSNSLGQSYALITKQPSISLSEQNIVDCAADYTTFGCSSGSRSGTLKFLQQKGVITQAKYPWAGTKQTCKNLTSQFKLTQDIVTTNGCSQLQAQLLVSPLTVAVNTTNWQFYKSGVLQNCGTEVNHDILVIGFTGTNWRLKNSWGVRWGEYGYIRIRNGDTCGICSKPGYGFKPK